MATFAPPQPPTPCRSGYQAEICLFMAPTNYSLGDYLLWSETDVVGRQQAAQACIKIYDGITFTWGSLYSSANGNSNGFGSGGLMQQVGWDGVWLGMQESAGRAGLLYAMIHHAEVCYLPPLTASPTSRTPSLPAGPALQGWLSLSRKGGQVSAGMQVGSNAPVVVPGLPAELGPMLLGVQMLYGANFSVTLSNICISATTTIGMTWPPPPPPP